MIFNAFVDILVQFQGTLFVIYSKNFCCKQNFLRHYMLVSKDLKYIPEVYTNLLPVLSFPLSVEVLSALYIFAFYIFLLLKNFIIFVRSIVRNYNPTFSKYWILYLYFLNLRLSFVHITIRIHKVWRRIKLICCSLYFDIL